MIWVRFARPRRLAASTGSSLNRDPTTQDALTDFLAKSWHRQQLPARHRVERANTHLQPSFICFQPSPLVLSQPLWPLSTVFTPLQPFLPYIWPLQQFFITSSYITFTLEHFLLPFDYPVLVFELHHTIFSTDSHFRPSTPLRILFTCFQPVLPTVNHFRVSELVSERPHIFSRHKVHFYAFPLIFTYFLPPPLVLTCFRLFPLISTSDLSIFITPLLFSNLTTLLKPLWHFPSIFHTFSHF